jgi:hypothetical protein
MWARSRPEIIEGLVTLVLAGVSAFAQRRGYSGDV